MLPISIETMLLKNARPGHLSSSNIALIAGSRAKPVVDEFSDNSAEEFHRNNLTLPNRIKVCWTLGHYRVRQSLHSYLDKRRRRRCNRAEWSEEQSAFISGTRKLGELKLNVDFVFSLQQFRGA